MMLCLQCNKQLNYNLLNDSIMNTANRKRTEIDAELDRLEVEFEKNRKEMQRLADENRRAGNRYGELSNANHDINNRILTLLAERWESEGNEKRAPPKNLPRRGKIRNWKTHKEMKTMNANATVGDKIRIIHLRDEDSRYDGKEGRSSSSTRSDNCTAHGAAWQSSPKSIGS